MKKIFYILLFVLSASFYWGTSQYIENRTEAEDAFEYATMVEAEGHAWLYHSHHLLYGPTMKLCYRTLRAFGYGGRAFGVMLVASSLSAAGALFFFFLFCYRRFSLRPVSSLLATGLLAVSFGFWRYAAEAEIPLPASFLVLAALYYATNPGMKRFAFLLAIVFSVFSVLVHIMNAVAVFVAIPCFYLICRRWKAALLHLVLCAGIAVAVFFSVSLSHPLHSSGGGAFAGVGFGSFAKAVIAFCQCVVSGDFVLGFRSVRAFLGELFAYRMLAEEFFLGERLSRPFVLFSMSTFLLSVLLGAGCLFRAGWVWKNMAEHRERFRLPAGMAAVVVAAVWFAGYAGLLLCIEPGNPELWVMGLVPFWLLFCGLVLLPLTVDNRLWLPFSMLLVLFVHNGFGGIHPLGDPAKDYQAQKSKWILEHATDRDVVITAGNPVFERYLRYRFNGTVVYLHDCLPERLLRGDFPPTDGSIYVLGDVFDQIESLRVRFPDRTRWISAYAERIRPEVEMVFQDGFGGVYRLKVENKGE